MLASFGVRLRDEWLSHLGIQPHQ